MYSEGYQYHTFLTESRAGSIIDVAFSHPFKLIANALGVAPSVERGHRRPTAGQDNQRQGDRGEDKGGR